MKLTGLDHITINVRDLEKSKKFYEQVLKLKECGYIHMGDHTLTYYRLWQEVRLELIDYLNKEVSNPIKETAVGTYRHICFMVDQLEELNQICREKGVFVRKAPSYVEKLDCQTMLIIDPNGVEIEIIQR